MATELSELVVREASDDEVGGTDDETDSAGLQHPQHRDSCTSSSEETSESWVDFVDRSEEPNGFASDTDSSDHDRSTEDDQSHSTNDAHNLSATHGFKAPVYRPMTSITQILNQRSICHRRRFRVPPKTYGALFAASRVPALLRERPFNLEVAGLKTTAEDNYLDKIFASTWITDDKIVTGSKDNSLVVWDVNTGKGTSIPYYDRTCRPSDHCGIHCVQLSPDGTHLATSGLRPEDLTVIEVESMSPVMTGTGHTDWLFCTAWLSSEYIVTGSRDNYCMLWKLGESSDTFQSAPVASRRVHENKVRDLSYNPKTDNFATVSPDGTLRFWDPHSFLDHTTVKLLPCPDLVTCCYDETLNTVTVGGSSCVQTVDPRSAAVINSITSPDITGIRSLRQHGDVLSMGGGSGKLAFLDRRTDKLLPIGDPNDIEPSSLNIGTGWLKMDSVYYSYFSGQEDLNAVYTHCWDPSGTKLFAAGGPLPFGLRGCYAALWE